MSLFGWLVKGRCDVSALDNLIDGGEVISIMMIAFIIYLFIAGRTKR